MLKSTTSRGVLKHKMGDKEGALEDYYKAISINPKNAEAYNSRGLLRTEMRDLEGALKDLNKAISINPNFDLAYFNPRGF